MQGRGRRRAGSCSGRRAASRKLLVSGVQASVVAQRADEMAAPVLVVTVGMVLTPMTAAGLLPQRRVADQGGGDGVQVCGLPCLGGRSVTAGHVDQAVEAGGGGRKRR